MRWLLILPLLAALLVGPCPVLAADPQPYTVTLQPSGNTALDQALHDVSQLVSLRETAPVGPFALVTRAREDVARFQTALRSFGYHKGQTTLTIDGRSLDDMELLDLLARASAKAPVPVVASFELGPLFRQIGRAHV